VVQKRSQGKQLIIKKLLGSLDLWQSGKLEWRSRCPFHKGDNPTVFRITAAGNWKCFRCGAYGDLVGLVMKLNNLSFKQASEMVGSGQGMFLSFADMEEMPDYKDWRKSKKAGYPLLREADIVLAKRFCPTYLLERGFSEEVLSDFEVGYDQGKSRIVFPVRDVDHRLVGITLRRDFDGDGPKYWHDHFDKSLHLYGFHRFKNRPVDNLFLVEGQLDAIRLHQLGLAACAILGSSISAAQVDLLNRYAKCEHVVLTFDNDEAGEMASMRSLQVLCRGKFSRGLERAVYPTKDPGELSSLKQISVVPWYHRLFRKFDPIGKA
jgi:DNA primase